MNEEQLTKINPDAKNIFLKSIRSLSRYFPQLNKPDTAEEIQTNCSLSQTTFIIDCLQNEVPNTRNNLLLEKSHLDEWFIFMFKYGYLLGSKIDSLKEKSSEYAGLIEYFSYLAKYYLKDSSVSEEEKMKLATTAMNIKIFPDTCIDKNFWKDVKQILVDCVKKPGSDSNKSDGNKCFYLSIQDIGVELNSRFAEPKEKIHFINHMLRLFMELKEYIDYKVTVKIEKDNAEVRHNILARVGNAYGAPGTRGNRANASTSSTAIPFEYDKATNNLICSLSEITLGNNENLHFIDPLRPYAGKLGNMFDTCRVKFDYKIRSNFLEKITNIIDQISIPEGNASEKEFLKFNASINNTLQEKVSFAAFSASLNEEINLNQLQALANPELIKEFSGLLDKNSQQWGKLHGNFLEQQKKIRYLRETVCLTEEEIKLLEEINAYIEQLPKTLKIVPLRISENARPSLLNQIEIINKQANLLFDQEGTEEIVLSEIQSKLENLKSKAELTLQSVRDEISKKIEEFDKNVHSLIQETALFQETLNNNSSPDLTKNSVFEAAKQTVSKLNQANEMKDNVLQLLKKIKDNNKKRNMNDVNQTESTESIRKLSTLFEGLEEYYEHLSLLVQLSENTASAIQIEGRNNTSSFFKSLTDTKEVLDSAQAFTANLRQ